jgi:hypothetical protein
VGGQALLSATGITTRDTGHGACKLQQKRTAGFVLSLFFIIIQQRKEGEDDEEASADVRLPTT